MSCSCRGMPNSNSGRASGERVAALLEHAQRVAEAQVETAEVLLQLLEALEAQQLEVFAVIGHRDKAKSSSSGTR